MQELDNEPNLEELSKAIDNLASGKAPGSNSIPPDLLKQSKTILLQLPTKGALPVLPGSRRTTGHAKCRIITLYKNKGDRSDCKNNRGIFLLSIVGKFFTWVMLVRLQKLAELLYPESQCRFRAHRSTVDMIFSIRQLQEKCREQQRPL